MIPDYKVFNFIRTTFGLEALKHARVYEHTSYKINKFKDHLHFNHRLKENNCLPPSLQFNSPIKSKKGFEIANRSGMAYLRLRISDCHYQIKKLNNILSETTNVLQSKLDDNTWPQLKSTVDNKNKWITNKRRDTQEKKLKKITKNKTSETTRSTDVKKRWVLNLSDKQLSDLEKSALELGFNFAISPKELPTFDIITSVEAGIRHLPDTDKDLVRASITNIISRSKLPHQANITKEQLTALTQLAKNTNLTILPADKGRTVVIMNSADYSKKILDLLSDDKTYRKITDKRRNPTTYVEKIMNRLLADIKEQRSPYNQESVQLDKKLYYKLHSTDAKPATFYGLPKIHKDNIPLRPITSAVCSPTYETSKFLANTLKHLQSNRYSVKNSQVFAEKVTKYKLEPDEMFVSFDVVSLFTSIPTDLALTIVQQRLDLHEHLSDITTLSKTNILKLLELILNNCYFSYQGSHYQQIYGCPMGSPVSAILANIVMEHIEEIALSTAPHPPKWWFRYVDDSHVGIYKLHVDEFHDHLNSVHPSIQFTVEKECNNSIAFLDTTTTRHSDGSITTSVYRKPTHTDKYLDYNSHHHQQHKRSVATTLLNRSNTIPTTEEEKLHETRHVLDTLQINNYPVCFLTDCLKSVQQKHTQQQQHLQQQQQQDQSQGFTLLPYVSGTSEKIARVLKSYNVKVAHKPVRTISSILTKPKDKVPKADRTNVVYKIKCNDCSKTYIGQTQRALKTRVKEHQKAVFNQDKNSLIAEHCTNSNHNFDFDNTTVLDYAKNWNKRLLLEAFHSKGDVNSINEHIQIPRVYEKLLIQ